MFNPQRWLRRFPYIIAMLVFAFIAQSAWRAVVYPYEGLTNSNLAGDVIDIEPSTPVDGVLLQGDIIQEIDGVPVEQAQPYYPGKKPGDHVQMLVQRDEALLSVSFTLIKPTLSELLTRLVPLIVALVFWALGTFVQAFMPAGPATSTFFLFFQAGAALLSAGVNSYIGPPWVSNVYSMLLWVIGPLAVHFHLYFPQENRFPFRRVVLWLIYAVGLIGGFAFVSNPLSATRSPEFFDRLIVANRIFTAFNLILVVVLLVDAFRYASTPGVRGKIRLVVLGGVMSFVPLVLLILLPAALSGETIIPYSFAFLFLGILPLTYGYAIFRHRLIEFERHINRGATFILVYSILGGFYLLLYVGLVRLLPAPLFNEPLINTVLVLVLASVIVPLHSSIQRFVDVIFYGGWYDYRSAVTEITYGLEQIADLHTLALTVSERLVRVLRLNDTCVFLSDPDGSLTVIEVAPRPLSNGTGRINAGPLPRSSLEYLLKVGGAIERTALRSALAEAELSPQELQLLNSEQINLWVPVIGHGQLLGLLALGPKYGGDIFSGEDMDILRVVSRQMGTVIENIHLVKRLQRHAASLEQRVAERTEELYTAKERVEAILRSVGEGVMVTDLEGNLVTVNDAYERQSGFNEIELIGQKIWSYYHTEESNDSNIEGVIRNIRTGTAWQGELIGLRKNNERYDVQVTITPLRDGQNQIVGFVGSQRDITRQKELDRLKDMFVSDVSHELRTPTTNISLYLDLLETAPAEKRENYLKVLKDQSRLLMKLVEEILDLSRLSMSKYKKVDFTEVDLNKISSQIVLAHQPLAEAVGVNLLFEPDEALMPVWGEANQLARLLNNLLSNALRYTVEGEVVVQTLMDGDQVCLDVCDTGMGIEPDDRPHLFDRFYRGRRVRQSKIHGTGLGLAIVKEIVDLHGCDIDVQSEVGKGSRFRVRFPNRTGD